MLLIMPDFPQISFSDAKTSFLRDCKMRNFAPATVEFYKYGLVTLEQFMRHRHLELSRLTLFDLSHHYMNYMIDRQFASHYIRGRIATCKEFFKYLWQESYYESNLAADFRLIKAEPKAIFTFSKEQVEMILQQPDITTFTGLRDRTLMLVLLETGIRVMELTNLNIQDIDYENQTLRICRGKGRKPRLVPIQHTCLSELDRYLHQRGTLPIDALWITLHNTPLQLASIKKLIITYCKAAHIQGTRGSAHTFRHTMAKFYLLSGGDPFSLMHILGHTNVDMTKRYIDLFNRDLHDQHEKASPVETLLAIPSVKENEVEA